MARKKSTISKPRSKANPKTSTTNAKTTRKTNGTKKRTTTADQIPIKQASILERPNMKKISLKRKRKPPPLALDEDECKHIEETGVLPRVPLSTAIKREPKLEPNAVLEISARIPIKTEAVVLGNDLLVPKCAPPRKRVMLVELQEEPSRKKTRSLGKRKPQVNNAPSQKMGGVPPRKRAKKENVYDEDLVDDLDSTIDREYLLMPTKRVKKEQVTDMDIEDFEILDMMEDHTLMPTKRERECSYEPLGIGDEFPMSVSKTVTSAKIPRPTSTLSTSIGNKRTQISKTSSKVTGYSSTVVGNKRITDDTPSAHETSQSINRDMLLGGHVLKEELKTFEGIIEELEYHESKLEEEEASFMAIVGVPQRDKLGAALRKKTPTQDDLLILWGCASEMFAKIREFQTFARNVRQELKDGRERMGKLVSITSGLAKYHWETLQSMLIAYDEHTWSNPHSQTPRGEPLGTVF